MGFSLDRAITLTALTCAVLLAAGCKEKTPEFFQAPQATPGAMQGTILCDGQPLPGETPVMISGPVSRTTTATDGSFDVSDLPPGTYTVTITPPDHVDCPQPSRQVTVTGGETASVTFECALRTPVRADVLGKAVIDYADAPAGEDNVPPEGDDNTCGIGEEGFQTAAQLEAGEGGETEIVWNFRAFEPDAPDGTNIRGPLENGEHQGMSGTVVFESGIEAMEEYMVTFSFAKDGTVVFEGVSWVTFTDPSTGAFCVIHRAISGEIVEDGS